LAWACQPYFFPSNPEFYTGERQTLLSPWLFLDPPLEHCVSASEMTDIVSGGALNSTNST